MKISKSILVAVLGVAASVTPALATVYSAVNDFPNVPASATNGVWSYGYSSSLTPVSFVLDNTTTTDFFGNGDGAVGFYTPSSSPAYGSYPLPAVLKNTSAGDINVVTVTNWSNNLLLLHPGPAGDYSIVRFTAPVAATYTVSGIFTPLDSDPTNVSATITTASTVYSTTSDASPHSFIFNTTLGVGQTVDFAVGFGVSNSLYNDSTGFNATITATPEPGLYGLVALGFSGLIVAVRRRKA